MSPHTTADTTPRNVPARLPAAPIAARAAVGLAAAIVALAGISGTAALRSRPTLLALPAAQPSGPRIIDLGVAAPGRSHVLGAPAKEQLGNHLAAGDINGDGLTDVLAGAHWGSEGGRNNVGRAYVLFGRSEWPPELDLTTTRQGLWSFIGEGKEPRLGVSVAAGDLSGDGVDDVVLGALLADPFGQANAGALYVMHGNQAAGGEIDFLNSTPDLLVAGRSDATGSDQLGTDLVVADLDGDGFDDLVAAAALRNGFQGAVFGWWGPLPSGRINLQRDDADWWIEGEAERGFFGTALATGPLDGSHGLDLVVGAFAARPALGAAESSGAVYVFDHRSLRAGGRRTLDDARTVVTGPAGALLSAAQSFGTCSCHGQPLAVAELTGDGLADLVVGAPLAAGRAGTVFIIPGPLPDGHLDLAEDDALHHGSGAAAQHYEDDDNRSKRTTGDGAVAIIGGAREDRLGWSVAAGALDGDGQADLVLAAPGADRLGGAGATGVVYGMRGPFALLGITVSVTAEADLLLHGAGSSDGDGGLTVLLVDSDGDARDDLHIGLPDADPRGRSSVGELRRLAGPLLPDPPTATATATSLASATPTASQTASPTSTPTATSTAVGTPTKSSSPTPTERPSATTEATPGPVTPTAPTPAPRPSKAWLPMLLRLR